MTAARDLIPKALEIAVSKRSFAPDEDRISAFFEWLAGALFDGDLDWVDDVYIFPMSIFSGVDMRVDQTAEQMRAYILGRRAEVRAQGVASMRGRVLGIGRPTSAGYRVEVEFRFYDAQGNFVALNRNHYLCTDGPNGEIRISSLELTRLGIPFAREPLMRHLN